MLKRVTFGSFKSNNIKTLPPMPPSRTKVGKFRFQFKIYLYNLLKRF